MFHTATAHRLIGHNSKEDTYKTSAQLLGYHLACDNKRHLYTRELVHATSWNDPISIIKFGRTLVSPARTLLAVSAKRKGTPEGSGGCQTRRSEEKGKGGEDEVQQGEIL